MIQMILADDEPVIIKGIQKLVDFHQLGIEVVREFTDGKSALEGIIRLRPQLALLDISMPGMSGVEILKECYALGIETKIIFISGFQDFEYAKAALQYGAVDYLLKPVIREELLRALEKCFHISPEKPEDIWNGGGEEDEGEDSVTDAEDACYFPVYTEIFFTKGESEQKQKLLYFSLSGSVETCLEREQSGVSFHRGNRLMFAVKGSDRAETQEMLEKLGQEVAGNIRHKVGFVVGEQVKQMRRIPEAYEKCRSARGRLFFADQTDVPILFLQDEEDREEDWSRFMQLRERMIDSVIARDDAMLDRQYTQFGKMVARISQGRKEDACFHFCTLLRMLDEKFRVLGLPGRNQDMRRLLEEGRACICYREMLDLYREKVQDYLRETGEAADGNENHDFLKARAYIENHYDEDLTLGILAEQVHMNPYYFSTFFKKNAGENFKDYLNRIRLQHVVVLLGNTDLKLYEIAARTGFGDARVLSENFRRYYNETPNSYRKRMRKKKTEE